MTPRIAISISNHTYPFGARSADLLIPVAMRKKCGIEIRDSETGSVLRIYNPKTFKSRATLRKAILAFIK